MELFTGFNHQMARIQAAFIVTPRASLVSFVGKQLQDRLFIVPEADGEAGNGIHGAFSVGVDADLSIALLISHCPTSLCCIVPVAGVEKAWSLAKVQESFVQFRIMRPK